MYYPLYIVNVYILVKEMCIVFTVLKINLMWTWNDLQNTTPATIITH